MRLFMAPMTRLILISSLFCGGPVLAAEQSTAPPQPDKNDVITDSTGGQWRTLPNMTTPRTGHTATLLPDGRVLVVGGKDFQDYHNTAEIFDPAANDGIGAWRTTAPMNAPRASHTATLLPTGQVLVIGGFSAPRIKEQIIPTTHRTVEIYDPAGNGGQGSWTLLAPLQVPRSSLISIPLPNGKIVVVGAGPDEKGGRTIELYDPAADQGRGASQVIGEVTGMPPIATATRLSTGQILVVGVWNYSTGCPHRARLVTLSPDQRRATSVPVSATLDLCHPTVTRLPNGKILLAGMSSRVRDPEDIPGTPVVFLYDPTLSPKKTWMTIPPPPEGPQIYDSWPFHATRSYHSATWLPTGMVLFIGTDAVDLFDPAVRPPANPWRITDHTFARWGHTATSLPNGTVLVVGGERASHLDSGRSYAGVQIYEPAPRQ